MTINYIEKIFNRGTYVSRFFMEKNKKKRDPYGSLNFKIFSCYVPIASYLLN